MDFGVDVKGAKKRVTQRPRSVHGEYNTKGAPPDERRSLGGAPFADN